MPRRPMDPLVIHHHAGDIKVLVSSADTDGAMSMIETVTAPRGGPSRHNHSREDETFYVVSGTAEVRILDETFLCEAGDRVFGPRNLFHTYRNVGKAELKMVIVYTPGGFEQSFADATAMLADGKDQNDIGRMLAEKYGLTRGHLPA